MRLILALVGIVVLSGSEESRERREREHQEVWSKWPPVASARSAKRKHLAEQRRRARDKAQALRDRVVADG